MVYFSGGRWRLCPFVVTYTERGEQKEKHISDKDYWIDMAEKHEHLEIIEFTDADYTDAQKQRLEESERVPQGFGSVVERYVKDGTFPDEAENEEERRTNHPLEMLQRKKESEVQGQDLSEHEINEMMQGMELSEIDIRLTMGGL